MADGERLLFLYFKFVFCNHLIVAQNQPKNTIKVRVVDIKVLYALPNAVVTWTFKCNQQFPSEILATCSNSDIDTTLISYEQHFAQKEIRLSLLLARLQCVSDLKFELTTETGEIFSKIELKYNSIAVNDSLLYYKFAATNESSVAAMIALSFHYKETKEEKAIKWLQKAAKYGSKTALYLLLQLDIDLYQSIKGPNRQFAQMCFALVKGSLSLSSIIDQYKKDEQLLEFVCSQNVSQMNFLPENLLSDSNFMLKIVRKTPFCLYYMNEELFDEELLGEAVTHHHAWHVLQHLHSDMLGFQQYEIQSILEKNINSILRFEEDEVDCENELSELVQQLMEDNDDEEDPVVLLNIAKCYEFGYSETPIDELKSFQFCKKSAEKNFAPAKYKLGEFYLDKKHPKYNIDKGVQCIYEAAKLGNILAMIKLGNMYKKGERVPVNNNLSRKWLEKAALLGSKDAERSLRNFSS